jgi:ferredoxin
VRRPTARIAAFIIRRLAAKLYRVTLILPDGTERLLQVSEEEPILVAAFRAGLDLPSMCLQGWCLSCAGQVEGGGEWDQSESRRYYPQDRQAGFILLCTAYPRSDLVIRTHQRIAMRDHRDQHGLPAPRT